MDYFLVYLWTRLDTLQFTATLLAILAGFALLFLVPINIMTKSYLKNSTEDEIKYLSNDEKLLYGFVTTGWCSKLIGFCIFLLIFANLIPSQQDFATIYVLPKLAKNETVKSISAQTLNVPDKLLKLANQKLDELIKK